MLGLHLRSAPLLETWQHVLHLVAGGHSLDHAAGGHVLDLVAGGHVLDLVALGHALDLAVGGHVLDLVAVPVVGELDRPDNCRPVVACRGDHRGGGAVGQAQDHAVVTLHQHKCHKIQITHHYF